MNIASKPSIEEICAAIHSLSSAGVAIGFCLRDGTPFESYFSYSQEWLTHYSENNLVKKDPTILFGLSTNGVRTWAEISAAGFDIQVFEQARNFGINNGTVFSLRVNGSKTIASVSHNEDSINNDTASHILALLAMGTCLINQSDNSKSIELDMNDREYIRLCIEGKSELDIARNLGMSARQIRYKRSKLLDAVGVKTVPQLIYEVCSRGLV